MDFNVSSLKNKNSQNKVNTCMNSVKKIIYDYVPFESKPIDYGFWTWKGKVNKDTKVAINGKAPAVNNEVVGTIGQYTVHCGTIKPDGYFYGRDVVFTNTSSSTATNKTIWDYPKTNEYSYEVKVGTTDLSKITIPGVRPIILGSNFFGFKEVLYTSETEAEVVFKASATDGSKTETVEVTAGECNKYQEGICIGVVNEIANKKATDSGFTLLKIGYQGTEERATMGIYIDEETSSKSLRVYKTPVVDKLFSANNIDVNKTGKDPEVYNYSKTVDEKVDEAGIKTVITETKQPKLIITKVVKEGNKWKTEEHFEFWETTLKETKESVIQDVDINVAVMYETFKKEENK